jgi:hypothetical protein
MIKALQPLLLMIVSKWNMLIGDKLILSLLCTNDYMRDTSLYLYFFMDLRWWNIYVSLVPYDQWLRLFDPCTIFNSWDNEWGFGKNMVQKMIYIYDECETTSSLQCIYVRIMKAYIKNCKWNICFKMHSLR